MTEMWCAVAGWEGFYEVSDAGRVRSLDRVVTMTGKRVGVQRRVIGRLLRPYKCSTTGYLKVNLSVDSRHCLANVHRLVAEAFVAGRSDDKEVDHKSRVRANASASELRWLTHSNNCRNRPASGAEYTPRNKQRPWRARSRVNGRNVQIGYFATKAEAEAAFQAFTEKLLAQ